MRKAAAYLNLFSLLLLAAFISGAASAQTVIPQIADGGGWQTTIVLTNTSGSATTAGIAFFQETVASATAPWSPPFTDVNSTSSIAIPAGGTVLIHSAATASTTTVGWASVTGTSVSAYAIFSQAVTGRPNQDGTGVALAATSRVLVPYDNTNGFVTAVAIANTGSTAATITVGLENSLTSSPVTPAPASITLPANGHTAFNLPTLFAATTNHSGTAEFSVSGGTISALALRFDPTGSFASAPAYPESGAVILGGGSSGGGGGGTPSCTPGQSAGAIPSFTTMQVAGTGTGLTSLGIDLGVPGIPGPYVAQVSGTLSDSSTFAATFNDVTVTANSVVFSGFAAASSTVHNSSGAGLLTSGTINLTLVPGTPTSAGAACGSISFNGSVNGASPVAISASFSGTYTAQ